MTLPVATLLAGPSELPPSAQLLGLAEIGRAVQDAPTESLDQRRASTLALWGSLPDPDGVQRRTLDLGGVACVEITPSKPRPAAAVLWLHGGAFTMGSAAASCSAAGYLASGAEVTVVAVDYRLAPEFPFPAAVEDAVAAYTGLLSTGVLPQRIAVVGESAGGGLALSLLLRLKQNGIALPATAALLSPWADLTCPGESWDGADVVRRPAALRDAALYLNGTDPTDPLASPTYGDLRGLPPLLVQVGAAESLLCDTRVLCERAVAAGVDVLLQEWPHALHTFHGLAALVPEGAAAMADVSTWVEALLFRTVR